MILVDTSVWVDYLRKVDEVLQAHLRAELVLLHDFVLGELSLGQFRNRARAFKALGSATRAPVAADETVRRLIEDEQLFGAGIGYIDCHLLASTRLTAGAKLWTRDKRLAAAAVRLDCLADMT